MTNLLYTLLALFTLCAVMAAMIVTFRIVGVLGMTLFSLLLLIAIPMRPIPTQVPQPATETAFWAFAGSRCWSFSSWPTGC